MRGQMKIGLDLDDTVYQFPEFFKKLMELEGVEFFVTSGHTLEDFLKYDCPHLDQLGFDVKNLNASLLVSSTEQYEQMTGAKFKAQLADQLDYVFDNHADIFQKLTKTPIFKVPVLQGV